MASKNALARLLRYSAKHRVVVVKASLYSVVNKLFDIAPEGLIGLAVDVVVRKEKSFLSAFGISDVFHQLLILGGVTLIIWICESLFEYLYSISWRNLAQTVQHEMRMDAYTHIQQLDMGYYENQSTGNMLSIMNDDINQLERFLDNGANALIQVSTSVVVIGSIFFFVSPQIAIFAMMPMPFILVGAFYFQRRLAPLYAVVRGKAGELSGRLANNLAGIATIKSYTAERYEANNVQKKSMEYLAANSMAIRMSSSFIPIIRMCILSGFVMTLVYGGYLTLQGALAVGSYGMLVFLTQRLLWPLTSLAQTVDLYERAMASTSRVLDLLEVKIGVSDGHQNLPAEKVAGQIKFVSVDFCYEGGNSVLNNFNLCAEAGQTIALVGATGGGKSTIAKLLLRFYDPTAGEILLDGQNLKTIKLSDLRNAIGFVSQDVFLVDGTIGENIAYGKSYVPLEDVVNAAKVAEVHDFIVSLPEGYHTKVGERGQKLSGGQRQRISIARAVLKNPPVLIFDEATSAVDNETEAAIQVSLEKISRNRTTLVIAHRLSTVRNAYRICVLENGVVTESGTHAELLAMQGAYARLWKVQSGEV